MTAENVISIVILLMSAAPMIIIGIVQYRSREPVGFWSGKKPPKRAEITDVKAYNRKHGLMWIFFGVGFVLCFVCGLFWDGLIAGYLCMIEVIGGIFVMVAYHNRLNRIYYKKSGDV